MTPIHFPAVGRRSESSTTSRKRGRTSTRSSTTDGPAVKRRRTDVTARHKAHEDTISVTVKTTMNSFCKKLAKDLHLPFEGVLADMNKAVLEGYIVANIHVVRLCAAGQPINQLDQTFFSRCMYASMSGVAPPLADADFHESVRLYNQWRAAHVPRANSEHIATGWQPEAAKQMKVNAENAVCGNFFRRFNKHLKSLYSIGGRDAYQLLRVILDPGVYTGSDQRVIEWRSRIPRDSRGRLEMKPHLLLPLTFRFLSYVEEHNQEIGDNIEGGGNGEGPKFGSVRLFSLLPFKKGFRCSYFKMNTTGLHSLLRRANIDVPPLTSRDPERTLWRDVASTYWRKLFNIENFETTHRKFAGEILTDGKSVSVIVRKPKIEVIKSASPRSDHDVLWGLDPGRRDLFVATSSFGQKISCSACEFYEDARYIATANKMKGWINRTSTVTEVFTAMPTHKTASLVNLRAYVEYVIPQVDMLLGFERDRPFRKLRLKRYIFAKKKLRELCLALTEQGGRDTIVGFGDWSNNDLAGRIKRHPKAPIKPLERELKRYCTVKSIDEFRTSKLHADCHRELSHQYSLRLCRDSRLRTCKAYSVLHCRNSGCFGTTVNRDENASRNILLLLQMGDDRPVAFRRGTRTQERTKPCPRVPSGGTRIVSEL